MFDQVLPHTFDHINTLGIVGELALRRSQNAFESHQDEVTEDERFDVRWPAAHKFLFEFDDGIANGRLSFAFGKSGFHRKQYLIGQRS